MCARKRIFAAVCLASLWLALAVVPVMAEEAEEDQLSGAVLNNIVVTATGYEQDVIDAPATITVISREELEKKQFSNLADAVRGVEGITQTGGYNGGFSIRGMSDDAVLILIDGKRQDTKDSYIKHSGGSKNASANNFIPPLEAIERIEIIRGPMSTLYGSDALGGVINIITRKSDPQWHGSVSWEHTWQEDNNDGDNNQYGIYLSGPLVQDKLSLQFWGSDKRNQGNHDDTTTSSNDTKRQSGTARLFYTPVEGQSFMFEAGQQNQTYYSDGSGAGYTAKNPEYEKKNYTFTYDADWKFMKTEFNVYRTDTERQGINDTARPRIKNDVIDGKLILPTASNTLVAGGQWKKKTFSSEGGFYVGAGTGTRSATNYAQETYAFYMEDEFAATDWLSLVGGVRYDHDQQFGSEWTPRVYALWRPTPEFTVKGGVAMGYRAPTAEESDPNIAEPKSTGTIWGNPDLDPEKSTNYELGAYYSVPKFSTNLTVFYTDYENKIAQVNPRNFYHYDPSITTMHGVDPTNGWVTSYTNGGIYGGGGWGTYVNYGKATVRGIELAFKYNFTDNLSARLNYTWTDSEIESDFTTVYGTTIPLRKGSPITETPEHMANLNVDWQAFENLGFFAMAQYRGKETSSAWTGTSTLNTNDDDLFLFDTGVNWKVNKNLMISGVVYNIFDQRRSDSSENTYSYDEYGRRFWVKVSASF